MSLALKGLIREQHHYLSYVFDFGFPCQDKLSADQYHAIISQTQVQFMKVMHFSEVDCWPSFIYFNGLQAQARLLLQREKGVCAKAKVAPNLTPGTILTFLPAQLSCQFIRIKLEKIAKPHAEKLHAHNSSNFFLDPKNLFFVIVSFCNLKLCFQAWLNHIIYPSHI